MVAIVALLLVAGVWMLSGQIGSTLSGSAECLADPSGCGDGGSGGPGGSGPGGGEPGVGGTSTTRPASTTTTTTGT
jgi:hypothetical protein